MTRARAAFAVAALLAAYALLRAVAAPPEPAATLARPAVAAPPGGARERPPTAGEVREVLAARAAGYAGPAAADPDEWSARGCGCRAVDVARLRRLAARGLALRGHRSEVVALRLVRAGPRSVTAVVADRTSAYVAVDRRGRTVARWPASGVRRWRVTLVRADGRWVLGRVSRAPPRVWRGKGVARVAP